VGGSPLRNGESPKPGDRFRVQGRQDLLSVHVLEMKLVDEESGGTRYLVRTKAGARWMLSPGDPLHDDIPFTGRPLPADPAAPTE
jgi:hypothetical protein